MDIADTLEKQALEIAEDGHNGWGNTMADAALEIKKLRIIFGHIHENNGIDDACAECGLDLRNPIHTRL